MAKAARVIALNGIVLFALLGLLNLTSALFLKYSLFDKPAVAGGPENAAYAGDRDEMRRFFSEYSRLEMEYRSFTGWGRLPFAGAAITIDGEGNRVHMPPKTTTGGAPIARFFGGSTMWGTGAVDSQTIPAQFNRTHPDWRIFNHGETAFVGRQSLARLVNLYSVGARADLVVFYDGVNDVGTLCRREVSIPGTIREEQLVETLRGTEGWMKLVQAMHTIFLADTARLASTMALRMAKQESLFACANDPQRAEAVAEHLVSVWRLAHDLTVLRGGRFIGILQPVAYLGHARIDHVGEDLASRGTLGEQFKAVYPLIREKMRSHDYLFDFSNAYDGSDYIFSDWAHANAKGNAIMTRRISDAIRSRGIEAEIIARKPSS